MKKLHKKQSLKRKSSLPQSLKRKSSLPIEKKKAWKLFSEIVRRMYANEDGMVDCVTCGRWHHWKDIHAGHFLPKSRGTSIYFECANVHPQCPHCNTYQHGNLINYFRWMETFYGRDEIDRLEKLAKTTVKYTRQDYIDMQEHYKMCLLEL